MKKLQNKIQSTESDCIKALESSDTIEQLESVRIEYLGRKGIIAQLMPLLASLSVEEKRTIGPLINQLKQNAEIAYNEKKSFLGRMVLAEKEEAFKDFDVTAYKPGQPEGSLHPHTLALQKFEAIFSSMGYAIVDGPEVETEYYNFDALNIPGDHPARDMFDTFWMDLPGLVLRTHTSPVQIREMQNSKKPLAIVAPGRVYRHEAIDASHEFMFRQIEGLLIGENISMSHLIATIEQFLQAFFEKKDLKVRVRPGYFPFVEPGIEVDMSCPFCKKGCSVCKKTTWIELMGAGLVHPNVLKHGGYDPKKYSGFAFGFGLTRLVMLKYGINDIRLLHTNNVEFLKQF